MARRPYQVGGFGNPDFPDSDHRHRGQRKSAAFDVLPDQQAWERCVVRAVYPDTYTCDIYTQRGRFLSGAPWPGSPNEINVPRVGEQFGVHYGLGTPTTVALAADVERAADNPAFRVSPARGFGGEDPVYSAKGSGNQRGEAPPDVLPGDWLRMGDLGNMIGVLAGGAVVVKAGDLAQIIATQARNLVRLVGQNAELFTGAGTLECKAEDGKTSIVMRVGADAATESTPTEENFRIRCELGDEGELVDFRVTDGQGRDLYRQHIDPDGRVQKVAKRETAVYEEDLRVDVGTNEVRNVKRGQTIKVGGSQVQEVGAKRTLKVGGANRMTSGGDASLVSMHDVALFAKRFVNVAAGGDPLLGGDAVSVSANNGDVSFLVGSPLTGDSQLHRSAFKVVTVTGDVTLRSLAGRVELNSSLPSGVKVGGPGPGLYSAVLYEHLLGFMEAFGLALDLHIHPFVETGVPGAYVTAPSPTPAWNLNRGLFYLARSTFLSIGG